MYDKIIEAQLSLHSKQAARVSKYFRSKFSQCDGRQYSQIITCLNALYKKEHNDDELIKMITDGDGDGGLADAFVFCKDSVDIFDFKEGSNLGLRDIQQLRDRIEELLINKPDDYELGDIRRIKKHLKQFHSSSNKRKSINVYIIRKKFSSFTKDISSELKKIKDNSGVNIKFLDNKGIVDLMLEQDYLPSWSINKNSFNVLCKKRNNGKYDYLVAMISLKELILLYDLHLSCNKNLFAQNIRTPKINKKFSNGVFRTIENNTNIFFLFHNGITITTSSITENARSIFVSEPQVVNGAQTIGNLYNKYKDNLSNKKISEAYVVCKIVKAEQGLTDLICEASNTQKAVKVEDLRVNDSFQKEIEIYIKSKSCNKYEYVRKGNKKEKNSIIIAYVKFFQWAYAALLKQPAKAKNAKKLIFETDGSGEYNNIKTEIEHNISKIIRLCDIGTFVENKIKITTNKEEKGLLRDMNLHIIAGIFLSTGDDFEKNLKNIFKLLKSHMLLRRKNNPLLTNGQIFAQSDLAWKFLKNKI